MIGGYANFHLLTSDSGAARRGAGMNLQQVALGGPNAITAFLWVTRIFACDASPRCPH
jgi:hypothetical protein